MTAEATAGIEDYDAFEKACAFVGKYLWHFAILENFVNSGVQYFLSLDDDQTAIITSNMDFSRKVRLLRACINMQSNDSRIVLDEEKSVFSKVLEINNDRIIVAHSRFEYFGDGVRFERTTADKKLSRNQIDWSADDFGRRFYEIDLLNARLHHLITSLEPYRESVLQEAKREAMITAMIFG